MNQEITSENTVESTETNPIEGETENNQEEKFINNAPIVESENQVNENENQVNESENQVNESENQVNTSENQFYENENQVNENENQSIKNATQLDENEKQCCPVETEIPSEEIIGEEPAAEQNIESKEEPKPNVECVLEEKPLVDDSVTSLKLEVNPKDDLEIQGIDSQPGDSSMTQSAKDKTNRNQKRGHKNSKAVNCDKYGWPIGSKYCTEVNDSSNDVNFAEDVDLASCETKVNADDKVSQEITSPDEEILYVVKSPSHRTANTKRTIVKVEEVEGAITDGIHAGTHLPHFLNYLSLQVKFKFTLARLPDGKLKITFRFVGKGGESLKDIICLWLRRNDEDKDKIVCEGLTRNKEVTLSILARKFHEIENLKEDIVSLYEEIKKLVPEYRGKEGLRSEDEPFLEAYRNLDNKLLILIMLLFKDNCENNSDSKLLSKFRDLYFSLQIRSGFTVKQYLYVIYCYNMIFTPYLPQELEEMVNKYAVMKNITLPDSPPLVIPPCGQKSKLTVINPFAKKKLQNTKQEDNRAKENTYAEYEMVPVKTDETEPSSTEQHTEPAKKNVPKKRQTYRRNRRPYYKKNNQKNSANSTKTLQAQRNPQNVSNAKNNLRNQFNNLYSRNRQNTPNQRDNSFRQSNVQNARNPRNQAHAGNTRNPSNKRQQGIQGGSATKKRIVNQSGSVDRDTLPNPVASVEQEIQENSTSPRNQPISNRRNQNKRSRPRTRPRRKNISNQQNNDHSRNNQQNPRNNVQSQRNNLQSQRNNLPNQRNISQNQRNNVQSQRNNQNSRNEKNNSSNERNNQSRNSRSRRRSDLRKRMNSDQYFGMSNMPQRNQGFSSSSNNHEFLLNSLRNQNLMQSNMRNQEMGRNQNFNNDRNPMFSQSNSRNQNFTQDNSQRHNNFSHQSHQPRSLFAQQYFDMPRNQNYTSNNSGNQNFSQTNSRRPLWSSDFAGCSQNYFSGSSNFSNRSNSMNRILGGMPFSNYNSRMSFDDDMHTHNFMNSNNHNWDNDFNRGKRKNIRDDWNSKRPKRGI